MTREELVEHLEAVLSCDDGNGGPANIYGIREAADRILAAIEDEKKGEVVIGNGDSFELCIDGINDNRIVGKKGQLIFRPDTGKEE